MPSSALNTVNDTLEPTTKESTMARVLAKKLRKGESLNYCDSTIQWDGKQFTETHLGVDPYSGHFFHTSRIDWQTVLNLLKTVPYR